MTVEGAATATVSDGLAPPCPPRSLTRAEEAVWFSDRPRDPRVVVLVAGLAGAVDPDTLSAAADALLRRRPLLRSRPLASARWARCWGWVEAPADAAEAVVVASAPGVTVTTLVERLRGGVEGLRRGVALGLLKAPQGDTVVLVVHHALTDGLGALLLLGEILGGTAVSGIAVNGTAVSPTAAGAATRRTAPEGTASVSVRAAAGSRATASRLRVPGAPARIAPQPGHLRGVGYGFVLTVLEAPAPPPPAARNDVLLAASVLAVERWNALHRRRTGRVVVNMPVSLTAQAATGGGDGVTRVGNGTGLAVLTLAPQSRARSCLLPAVVAQTSRAKSERERQLAPAERAVRVLGWLPAVLRRRSLTAAARVVLAWRMPTVTVTNLGPAERVLGSCPASPGGSALTWLRSLHFLTPAGMPQGVTVSAVTLAGTAQLGLTYSRRLFDDAAAQAFLELVAAGVVELSPPSARPDVRAS